MQNLQYGYPVYPIVKNTTNYGKTLVDVTNANFMYTRVEKHTNNGVISIHDESFALGTITKVVLRKYGPGFHVPDDFIFTILPHSGTQPKQVRVPKSLYGKSGMIPLLTEAGIFFVGNHSDAQRASLIINWISGLGLLSEEKIRFCNGYSENQYPYLTNMDPPSDISSPFYHNRLLINEELTAEQAIASVYASKECIGDSNWLQLLVLKTIALMHSIFAEKGYLFKKIIVLNGIGAEDAAKFLQVYNMDENACLNLKKQHSKR